MSYNKNKLVPPNSEKDITEPAEYVVPLTESDIIHFMISGEADRLPGFQGQIDQQFTKTKENGKLKSGYLYGTKLENDGELHSVNVLVMPPSFWNRAIAKAIGKEPHGWGYIEEKKTPISVKDSADTASPYKALYH